MTQMTTPYPAPDFSLPDHDGHVHRLADYAGQWLVVYFYPKDDTPGCTLEACSIRDERQALADIDVAVLGISKDSVTSHKKFHDKYQLTFPLLADESGATIEAYGAWGPKMFGRLGIQRKTFVINPKGQVVKVYGRVTPAGHGAQIASDIRSLQQR